MVSNFTGRCFLPGEWLVVWSMGWRVGSGAVGSAGGSSPGTETFFLDAGGLVERVHPWFHEPEEVPDEAAELAGDRHGDFVTLLAAGH